MSDEEDRNDNVTPFPSGRTRQERRGMRLMRVANDGRSVREPAINLPPATKAVCLLMIAVHAVQWALPFFVDARWSDVLVRFLAFVPVRYTGGEAFGIAALVSPVTHMFVHGGWLHLGVNVLSLMAFGAGMEKGLGARRMLLVFFLSGFAGALAQGLLTPHLADPMVGASGAISGLFGALLVQLHDRGQLRTGGRNPLAVFAAVWIATSLFFGFFGAPGAEGAISWATHIGGFLAGMALARPVGGLKL